MNPNYEGSLAQRFIRMSSGVQVTSSTDPAVFDSYAIFVPSTLATGNLVSVSLTNIKTTPVVQKVTAENYNKVMKGDLLSQWGKIFNDGGNIAPTLYIVVFYVPDGSGTDTFADYLTVTDKEINYAPLTAAFELTYPSAFFKSMFSPRYDGTTPGTGYDDQYYWDLELSLSLLCLLTPKMSFNLAFAKVSLPLATVDSNKIKILSKTRAEEIAAATALNVTILGVTSPRTDYFWGMLNLLQASNTWLIVHSEAQNILPVAFEAYYTSGLNLSGTYLGNKIARLRLTGVKPTGVPSIIDSEYNTNMSIEMSELLDAKNVAYLFSIADSTGNDAVISYVRGITGVPLAATSISKFVDYSSAQKLALIISDKSTGSDPTLRNEIAYNRCKEVIVGQLQKFARSGRLSVIELNFPAYADLPASRTDITVTQGWKAEFADDLDHVAVSGLIDA